MRNSSFLAPLLVAAGLFLLTPGFGSAAEVYLMRGGFDVFSLGMNDMAYQLRSEGINATAGSFASWKGFADDIIRRSKTKSVSYPVVFVGHSFGADAGPDVANYLGKNGIPVALVIGFDAVSNKTLHWGAKQVVHYCTPTAALYRAGAGFNGRIRTVNVARFGVNHFSIDENRQVQELAMQDIRAAVRKNR